MKMKSAHKPQRGYEQKARAAAAEASSQRILEAFIHRAGTEWFEAITLDALAHDAGVTVQTVVRKYGSKAGLLAAACSHIGKSVHVRRTTAAGDMEGAVTALADDYEASGKLILHLLNQEDRHSVLKPVMDIGRRGHREWLATVFAATLDPLTSAKRTAMLDALVVATDVYVWKLVRLDLERPVSAFKSIVRRLVRAALNGE